MDKKEEERLRGLQIQWMFVVLAALLALFLGVAVNALYDILQTFYSPWFIFIFFGSLGLLIADAFTYFLKTPQEIYHPSRSVFLFLWRYCKARITGK
jgi:hypothetical protein